jgi:hypothetical protein
VTAPRQLRDYPARLLEIADDLDMDCPRAVRLLAADALRRYAADLEHLALAYDKRAEVLREVPMRLTALIIALLLTAAPARAQVITSYTLTIYQAGTNTVVGIPTVIPVAALACNQPQPAAAPAVNPTRMAFNDPANAGQACIYTDPGTGPLLTLPFGAASYEGGLKATNSAATSAETRSAPFTHPGVAPAAPTGLRFVP